MENVEKTERKPQIGFPGTDALKEAIQEVKDKTGIKLADLGREALWEKIASIRKTHPAYEHERPESASNERSEPVLA